MSALHRDTRLVRQAPAPGDPYRPTSPPIHQTATFALGPLDDPGPYDYTRSGNPTRDALEAELVDLESGGRAFAVSSGMAAISASLRLAGPGERVLVGRDLYGGTVRFLERLLAPRGVLVEAVDTRCLDRVRAALSRPARLLYLETPTNPLLETADLAGAASLVREARRHGPRPLLVVDNTMLSPWLQNPLALGADLVLHSATKHLAGHGDVVAGAAITAPTAEGERLAEHLAFAVNAEGLGLAPFDAWLVLRGLKTLGVRLDRECASAGTLARALADALGPGRVLYPELAGHPGREVHRRQARGGGSVLAFLAGTAERARAVVDRTRLFTTAVSFGNTSSSIGLPCAMSHASVPTGSRHVGGLRPDLVRLSVGLEDPGDLLEDLRQALPAACGAR